MGRTQENSRVNMVASHTDVALCPRLCHILAMKFLPANRKEMLERGWEGVDVVLVTGDAYVDHPSFGVALIGRWLEHHGYRVAVLSQPWHGSAEQFRQFGRPRLFFGITAGNMDSIIANYTGNARVRKRDAYSPGGDPYFPGRQGKSGRRRPDRATIRYAQLAREAYGDVVVVIGGLEASLRRFIHYDYQQEKLRRSILVDSKADVLVYGMGELAMLEIARRLERGENLWAIPGTCVRLRSGFYNGAASTLEGQVELPSWEEIQADLGRFLDAELEIDRRIRSYSKNPLVQDQGGGKIVQFPPMRPMTQEELDRLYLLPYTRYPHPSAGDVPAYRMIRHSVTIIRGCPGNCSFCAIARHQGPVVVSRSRESVLEEIGIVSHMRDFKGTISDLGGPTANLYGATCPNFLKCRRHDCLYPRPCRNLSAPEAPFLALLEEAEQIKGVRHLFISSGMRMELLLETPQLLKRLIQRHTPGALKIAPEHTETDILKLMHKPGFEVLEEFISTVRDVGRGLGRRVVLNPYFISAHPGCTLLHMRRMAEKLDRLRLAVKQFQDFTPTPGTISTAMFVSGLSMEGRGRIFVPRRRGERLAQRRMVEALMKKK